jgi:succinate dehydrogenase / fumarate reductase, iron-sulfur subunit
MNPKNGLIKTYTFDVFRYDAQRDAEPRFQRYALSAKGETSVLEALLTIQSEQDPTLAFRYACRGAVCGSCAMAINGKLNLACRVLLKDIEGTRIVVEPLPHFDVLKDLIVDMTPFWEKYARIEPWLHKELKGEKENRVDDAEMEKIGQYVNCILCAICYGACPVIKRNEKFTGPAALAQLNRFLADPREERNPESLDRQDLNEGVWGCHTTMRCIDACPKNVRPTDGIEGARRKLVSQKFKKLLGRR